MTNTDQSKLEDIDQLEQDIISSVANDYYDSLKNESRVLNMTFEESREYVRKLAVEDVTQLIEQRCNVARIDELKQFTHSEGSIHLLADKVSYQPANHDPVHSWPIIDGKVIIIPQLYIKDRIKQLTNKKESL